jgi:hypothetical protein
MNSSSSSTDTHLGLAREAAREFCRRFGFTSEQVGELAGPPLFEPTPLDRDGRQVIAYRWLGGGRGGPYVQAEIEEKTGLVTVYGGRGHEEFGPWTYRPED